MENKLGPPGGMESAASERRGIYQKTGTIKNKALRAAMGQLIHLCENRDCESPRNLENAHIHARKMGGGERRDVEDNMVRLCRKCHHEGMGHGRTEESRDWMKALVEMRPLDIREALQEA